MIIADSNHFCLHVCIPSVFLAECRSQHHAVGITASYIPTFSLALLHPPRKFRNVTQYLSRHATRLPYLPVTLSLHVSRLYRAEQHSAIFAHPIVYGICTSQRKCLQRSVTSHAYLYQQGLLSSSLETKWRFQRAASGYRFTALRTTVDVYCVCRTGTVDVRCVVRDV